MGGISTGVGLVSGVNTAQLIEQLLAIEARPKQFAEQRIIQLQRRQAAFLDINNAAQALETSAAQFDRDNVFERASAASSDDSVMTASAGARAVTGNFSFTVKRLVTTQQQLSRGFVDSDTSGIGATAFTFETGGGGLASETRLGELNGGAGVQRGTITITDSTGASAEVDLSTAVTVGDVLDAINGASGIDVEASVDGDRLVVSDAAGGAGGLSIEDEFGSETAAQLGIAGSEAGGTITGTDIRTISGATALSLLNDGNGVHIRDGGADLEITARDGTLVRVDLGEITTTTTDPDTGEDVTEVTRTRAATVQDVLDAINQEASDEGVSVTASLSADGTGITITDGTGGGGNLIVRSATGRETASDLGIETDAAGVASSAVAGERLIAGLNSTLVRNLNGGAGLGATDLEVTDRAGNSTTVTISAGALSGSVTDLIDDINAQLSGAGVSVAFGFNATGNGLAVEDTSGGAGNLVIGGGAASELGVEASGEASASLAGANLQTKWLGLATRLDSLPGGGVGAGEFRITDASGASSLVTIDSNDRTLDDVIRKINSRPIGVSARINDQGDGILIEDTTGASGSLSVEDSSGTVARALNLVGTDEDDADGLSIDGSFERRVQFEATDTLDDVTRKINEAGVAVTAAVINDGSGSSPFRVSFASRESGSAGRVLIDTQGFDMGLNELTRGEDAVVFFGGSESASGVLLTSSTNTLDNVVRGVSIDLKGVSDEPVQITVQRDTGAIEAAVEDFVESFNRVLDTIDRYDTYDEESNTRGVLLSDSTALGMRSRLLSTVQGEAQGVDGRYQFLFQVGVRIGEGARLEFDRDRFRTALEEAPENVADLFGESRLAPREPVEVAPGATVEQTEDTYLALGVAEQIELLAEQFTSSVDGVIKNQNDTIDRQIELQRSRIARIDEQLEVKRTQLEREFIAMEQTIAMLQSQQQALGSLGQAG